MWVLRILTVVTFVSVISAASAQQTLNQEFLKNALRGSLPSNADCGLIGGQVGCALKVSEGVSLVIRDTGNLVDMKISLQGGTPDGQMESLVDILVTFGSRYGFEKPVVKKCFEDAVVIFMKNPKPPGAFYEALGTSWQPSVTIQNKNFAFGCRVSKPENALWIRGMLGINSGF